MIIFTLLFVAAICCAGIIFAMQVDFPDIPGRTDDYDDTIFINHKTTPSEVHPKAT